MSRKQVGARIEGDIYQGLFFWRQAAKLLNPRNLVERVVIEHDQASGVDDVVLFYQHPGIDAGGWRCSADFYQIKYHVDQRSTYSSSQIIDPKFTRSKTSLLQRIYAGYQKIKAEDPECRLLLASNWKWTSNDPLFPHIREADGSLPESFFQNSETSSLGRVREEWRMHLSIRKDAFEEFSRRLRIQLDHFGRHHFEELVMLSLSHAGLRIPADHQVANIYNSLVQQFVVDGPNEFDRETLMGICENEGLIEMEASPQRVRSIGIRSFMRFAELIEEETEDFICLAKEFEGRYPVNSRSWDTSAKLLVDYFRDPQRSSLLRTAEHRLILECHSTFAFLAGYELDSKTGANVCPVQKPNLEIWKPSSDESSKAELEIEFFNSSNASNDVAIALSITHDIYRDVLHFLSTENGPSVSSVIVIKPKGGSGNTSVKGASHAKKLATSIFHVLKEAREDRKVVAHLFSSAPNSLLFFLGQYREALGSIVLYEYDFDLQRSSVYEKSLALPLT